jgi:hypothetical protein
MEEVKLADGRVARRDERGRWREVETGRFVKKGEVKAGEEQGTSRLATRKSMVDKVRQMGLEAKDDNEAWGQLMGVQTEIALDKENGSRATAAAKLVAQASGVMEEGQETEEKDLTLALGRELALAVLALVEEELARRRK